MSISRGKLWAVIAAIVVQVLIVAAVPARQVYTRLTGVEVRGLLVGHGGLSGPGGCGAPLEVRDPRGPAAAVTEQPVQGL